MNAHAPVLNRSEIVEHALDYARRGWPVFPCSPATKQPLVKRGLYEATVDPNQIRAWWSAWPNAMIGVPTGAVSGVFAVDPDVPKRPGEPDGYTAWQNLVGRHGCPPTHSHVTPSGGMHVLFRWNPDRPVTNKEGGLKGTGINVRGQGGYVIAPPSIRQDGEAYRVAESLDWFQFAEAPGWLYDIIEQRPDVRPRVADPNSISTFFDRERSRGGYAAAALDGECQRVAQAGPGARNNALNEAAFRLGTLVGSGDLTEGEVESQLGRAAEISGLVADDGRSAVQKTIASGLSAGIQHPRESREHARHGSTYEWPPRAESVGSGEEQRRPPQRIRATPYVWTDPKKIPTRDWVYGRQLIRSYVAATIAPGAVGKTSLKVAETLAMVSGKDLLGIGSSHPPLRVWLWNLEDPRDEITRRIQATAMHYGLSADDIGDRLFFDTGREQECVIADTTRTGVVILEPVVQNLIAEIQEHRLDVVIVDPFVSSHRVSENDNNAIDRVAKRWSFVADAGNCAIDLVHHTRKMAGLEAEVTTETARGAKALTDACRSVVVLNRMTKEEGERAGIETPRLFFRTYNDKSNLAPPVESSDWFKLTSVDLGNGHLGGGDHVGVVTRWTWPDPMAEVTVADLRAIQTKVSDGKWRENSQARNWVGNAVAAVLGLDAENKGHRGRIAGMLKLWIANGMFVIVTGKDEKGNDRPFVEVGEWAND